MTETTTPLTPEREQALRQQINEALRKAGAYCGNCNFEDDSETCPDCIKVRGWYADAVLPIVREAIEPATKELAGLSVNAANALRDERRQYEIACQENARLRAEVAAARSRALTEAADEVVAFCPEHGRRETCRMTCHCVIAEDLRRLVAAPASRCTCEPSQSPYDGPSDPAEDCPTHGNPAIISGPTVQPCTAKHGALGRICERPAGHSGMHTGDGPNGGAVWEGSAE